MWCDCRAARAHARAPAAQLDHAHLVKLLDVFEETDSLILITELMVRPCVCSLPSREEPSEVGRAAEAVEWRDGERRPADLILSDLIGRSSLSVI